MDRKRIIAANWKMNLDLESAVSLATDISNLEVAKDKHVLIFPPSIYLDKIGQLMMDNDAVTVGAQNFHQQDKGAFTGEISAPMLRSLNINCVLVGHSERRMYFAEDNALLFEKLQAAIRQDMKVVFCCGESLKDRQSGGYFDFVKKQLEEALFFLNSEEIESCMIAYEPIWAIGTGETASPEQAQEMHAYIRGLVRQKYGERIAESIQILYGGSVKPANANTIFSKPDVDGGLVGGASLKSADFIQIIEA